MKPYQENYEFYEGSLKLTSKELQMLEELEKNQEVVYLLNTEECEFISKLIKSYKEIRRQLIALQMSRELQ